MQITFYGAAREVTGSMHLVDTGEDRILLDCGLFQGRRRDSEQKNRLLPFDPALITNLVLSHAHIDHSGRIPLLTAAAARGGVVVIPSFAFGRTQELLYVIHKLYAAGAAPRLPVYVDSPLATRLTRVFGEHPEVYDRETHRIRIRTDARDVNYLAICDGARGEDAAESTRVARGIRDVIDGERSEFALSYPCHSPDQRRWFYMRVTRAAGPGPLRIVVSHENITDLKLAEERLRDSEKALWREKQRLEEANTALNVLLRRRQADRRDMATDILGTLQHLVNPVLRRLKGSLPSGSTRALVNSLETRLAELTRPFMRHLSAVEATEKDLGKTLLAFACHDLKPSLLNVDQLQKVQDVENKLGVSLVAVDA